MYSICPAIKPVVGGMTGVFQYDVRHIGEPGGGGEYEVQLGFGWTNGVVLQLIKKYAETLHLPVPATSMVSQEALYAVVFASVLAVIAVGALVFVWSHRCGRFMSSPYKCLR